MVQGMIGANVEQLDALAVRLEQASVALLEIQSSLRALPRYVWQGSDANRFYQELDSELCVRMSSVASGLAAMSTTVAKNAAEQREASNATGELGRSGSGGSTELGPHGAAATSTEGRAVPERDWLSYSDNVLSLSTDFAGKSLSALELVAESSGRSGDVGFFGNLGVALGGVSLAADLAEGEYAQATVDVLRMGTGAFGKAAWIADVGLDVYEMNFPLTNERQDAVLEYAALQQFGVSTDQLSVEQAAQLSHRYVGPSGFVNMVTDSVNESASNPKNLVSMGIGAAGNALADGIWAGWEASRSGYEAIRGILGGEQ